MTIDIITVQYAADRVGEDADRALPDAALALRRGAGPHPATPTSGRTTTRTSATCTPTTRCTTARRWPVYLDAFAGTPPETAASRTAGLTFHRVAGHDLDTDVALDPVQRRAEQLLGGLRRGQPDEGVPQGDARAQPRHRDPPRADRGREPQRGRSSTAGSRPSEDDLGDAPAVPAHRQRRLGPRPGQRPQPVRRGRPARRRGRRRLRRRGAPPRRRRQRGPRGPARALRHRALRRRRGRGGDAPPARGRRRRPYPSSPSTTRRAGGGVRARSPTPRARPSASTATCTSARPCAPRWAGSSSTSRASRPSRSPSASCPTPRGATSPACCAPSTTPPSRWSRTCTPPTSPGPQITYRANEWAAAQPRRVPRGLRRAPGRGRRRPADRRRAGADRRLRGRQGRLRGALRGAQPAHLAGHPAAAPSNESEPHR